MGGPPNSRSKNDGPEENPLLLAKLTPGGRVVPAGPAALQPQVVIRAAGLVVDRVRAAADTRHLSPCARP